ncbi:MAG: hypothetical protein J5993_06135 [Clostridia bacterium]|nr:hypothetical protein [Clostridia bacterium]
MEQTELENLITDELSLFLEKGFSYESTYDKSTDTSCVYIHRFKRGTETCEIRTVTGGKSMKLVVYASGTYRFPDLFKKYKREYRAFRLSHLIKKASEEEMWRFFLSLIKRECASGCFFGIRL